MEKVPQIVPGLRNVKIQLGELKYIGNHKPKKYKIQIKTKLEDKFNDKFEFDFTGQNEEVISGLEINKLYILRVILLTENGKFYDGPEVPEVEFETTCEGKQFY